MSILKNFFLLLVVLIAPREEFVLLNLDGAIVTTPPQGVARVLLNELPLVSLKLVVMGIVVTH
jgi:hypothetical protein